MLWWWKCAVITLLSAMLTARLSKFDLDSLIYEKKVFYDVIPDLEPVNCDTRSHNSKLPEDWSLGPFMQIYVRGYKDTNGDGKGDLPGVIDALDYLDDLGITGLWLMPVTGL